VSFKIATSSITIFQEKRAIIYISQKDVLADVTFPSKPTVISLLHYDDMGEASEQPSPGYPVICVSVSWILPICKTCTHIFRQN